MTCPLTSVESKTAQVTSALAPHTPTADSMSWINSPAHKGQAQCLPTPGIIQTHPLQPPWHPRLTAKADPRACSPALLPSLAPHRLVSPPPGCTGAWLTGRCPLQAPSPSHRDNLSLLNRMSRGRGHRHQRRASCVHRCCSMGGKGRDENDRPPSTLAQPSLTSGLLREAGEGHGQVLFLSPPPSRELPSSLLPFSARHQGLF